MVQINRSIILLCLFLNGCALLNVKKIRESDVNAWKGASVSELETHPILLQMQLTKHELKTGSIVYSYVNAGTVNAPVNCTKSWSNSIQCNGGGTETIACTNQFLVKDGIVQGVKLTGQCYTDCSFRPASRPCD